MKRGIRGHDVSAQGIKSISQKCTQMGIDYLQLVLERSKEDFAFGKFTEEYANEIKAEVGEKKIAVLGSYINPSEPDDAALGENLARFKEKIRYASVLKPIVVGTETGIYIPDKTHSEQAYQRVLASVKELTKEAEKYGVCVGIEGVHVFVIDSPKAMARLMNDINSDNAKVIFDPCNLIGIHNYMNQDEIINEMFDLLADKIVCLHAKDFTVENGEMKQVIPGEGMLNYKLIFQRMKEHNLDIPVISEEIDDEAACRGLANLEKIQNELI